MSDNDKLTKRIRGSQKTLTQLERTAILDDYIRGLSWNDLAQKYNVESSTIARVRREYLVNTDAADSLKKARLPMLYEISSWILESFDLEELEKASLRERGRLFGTLQDKINQIEGVTGNVNVAIMTMTNLGLLDD